MANFLNYFDEKIFNLKEQESSDITYKDASKVILTILEQFMFLVMNKLIFLVQDIGL